MTNQRPSCALVGQFCVIRLFSHFACGANNKLFIIYIFILCGFYHLCVSLTVLWSKIILYVFFFQINFLFHLAGSHMLGINLTVYISSLAKDIILCYFHFNMLTCLPFYSSLQCLYCEKVFRDKNTLKDHMRKKQHRRINAKNKEYDKFYIINYLVSVSMNN